MNGHAKWIFKYGLVVLRPLFRASWGNEWPRPGKGNPVLQLQDLAPIGKITLSAVWGKMVRC